MVPPLVIVNPACGQKARRRELPQILSRVQEILGGITVRYTTGRGHARVLAFAGAQEGRPLIVVVGGDGTVSEVADGVVAASDTTGGEHARESGVLAAGRPAAPPMSLIDLGTGGDFRRSLGIGRDVKGCLEALARGRERVIDVGRATFVGPDGSLVQRHFVNVLSAGLGGLVDRYIERMPAWLGGKAGYYLAALAAVATSREQPLRARITWQGENREDIIPAYLVAVCNGRWFGGGMDVAPMALPDDGRLEVVTVTAPTKFYLAKRVRGVYTGRHLDEPTVHHFPCQHLELSLEDPEAERNYFLDLDGEAVGSLPLSVELLPRRLRLRV